MALFLISIQQSDPPTYWYNMSNNNAGSVCELIRVKECIVSSILKICGLIRYQLLRGNMTIYILKDKWKSFSTEYQLSDLEMETSKLNIGSSRKETFCVRIGKKLPTSDRNIFLQFGNNVKAPQVRTFEFTRILL